ncbi:MAG: hypothetical protein HQM09_05030 [Candidatus Riflebacteria bacterium]|nr:hypothetical protein [Candidatus Riflebacteria bacterium]
MLERPLKILVGIGLIVIYFQRLIFPMMADFNADRQILANMRLATTMEPAPRKQLNDMTSEILANGFNSVSQLLPAFDKIRDSLWSKVDQTRLQFPGIWEFHPAESFMSDGKIVRWPFRLHYEGSFQKAVSALAWLECSGQIVRLRTITITSKKPGEIIWDAGMELLSLDSALAQSLLAKDGRK